MVLNEPCEIDLIDFSSLTRFRSSIINVDLSACCITVNKTIKQLPKTVEIQLNLTH